MSGLSTNVSDVLNLDTAKIPRLKSVGIFEASNCSFFIQILPLDSTGSPERHQSTNCDSDVILIGGVLPRSKKLVVRNDMRGNLEHRDVTSLTRNVYDYGEDINKLMKTTHEVSLGLSPGLMYFLKEGFAF